jgi:hypothetical protein
MGEAVAKHYYGGEPISGEKIGPFMGATVEEWNPNFAHTFVNDIWNMRAAEYPGAEGGLYSGSPTLGQHNFTRTLADEARGILAERTGEPWSPKQAQAATWTGIKSKTEGTDPSEAALNFSQGLGRNYAQLSWESAPGLTTGHFPEFATAPPELRQAYHDEIRSVLTDQYGRDVIPAHLGMLTGPTIDAPGVYQGIVSPGSQSRVAVGQAPGGWKAGIDPASRELLNTSEAVRGLLLRQDAVAWHKPSYSAALTPKDANLVDIRLGRPLTQDEAFAVGEEMHKISGSDFFSPIGTENGFRFLNVPDASGLDNRAFTQAVEKVVGSNILSGDAQIVHAKADGHYQANDWRAQANGENYLDLLGQGGRPHVQRAAAELLATLGPRVAAVEDRFAKAHGWTVNPGSRIWTRPGFETFAKDVVPSPVRPWELGYPAQRQAQPDAISDILRRLGGP